ncbi:S-adenosyl-L-methionine-dependent methyltransferase [Glomus cerebriforme]|uniref:S-adenosyl-L-methionine-dependent methyltransferase n=1 Tax=Glomus cerebriforme TaxID=658196 RepID=A0A397SZA8_9GLOM|nr:S-adenosyl-L-methionine-dependent methyltransferase [Glomus cerebriforme]
MGNIFSFKKKNSSKIEKEDKIEKEPLKYFLPNFVKDTDIMVIFHFLGCYLFQGIFSAPIEDKLTNECCKVLDVGCGPGTWLLDLATIYKSTTFFGIDLFPVYPTEIKPSNVEFTQGDVLDRLPYSDNTFDYVHQGNMLSVFTLEEWQFVIQELIRVCKPGGYIEFTEPELATNTGPILTRFYKALIDLSASRNVNIRISRSIIEILESSSTVKNVEYKLSTVSLGIKRGGRAGQAYMDVHDGYFLNEPMPETLCKFMDLTKEEYLKLFDDAKKEVNNGIAPECDVYRIWCQKR